MRITMKKILGISLMFSLSLVLLGSESPALGNPDQTFWGLNSRPGTVTRELPVRVFDGTSNDLRTGGLGSSGILNLSETLASFDDGPKTADEARSIAIVKNYYSIMDAQTPGGYAELWGPTVGNDDPDGKLGGKEYWAYINDGRGLHNVRVVVQIPDNFDPDNSCIFTGPSSGSRGVFGAIGTTGDAGLKRGCAVAYTDKGTGTGVHALYDDTVYKLDLTASTLSEAGNETDFAVKHADLSVFPHEYPVAFKHAHSQKNPERNWGFYVLESIKYAFYVLNLEENYGVGFGPFIFNTIVPWNTIVISTSWSNGGKAVLLSGENDRYGLIDALVLVEPTVGLDSHNFSIRQGDRHWGPESVGWSLYDMHAYQNVYQTCANLAPSNTAAYVANFHQMGAYIPAYAGYYNIAVNRCTRLRELNLLSYSEDISALAVEAQEKLNTFGGFLEEQNLFQPVLPTLSEELTATYANAYGRFHVEDQLFGISFAQVKGIRMFDRYPASFSERDINVNMIGENLLGGMSGMVKLINNNAAGGPQENYYSQNVGEDYKDGNLTLALKYFKASIPGRTEWEQAGHELTKEEKRTFRRIQRGIRQTALKGKLHGKPTIIIQGRSDEVVHINHSSRAYLARYLQRGGDAAKMAFLEVVNGHHLEMLNGLLPAYGENSTYLHPYYDKLVGLMIDHLKTGSPLPGNQVIRTPKKGPGPITPEMFPEIQMIPETGNTVTWDATANTLNIPD